MSQYLPNLSAFSVLIIIAIFLPALVYGVMSVYLGMASGGWAVVQVLALMAVTIKLAKERLIDGLAFALGATSFTFLAMYVNVPDLFLKGFSALLLPIFQTVWNLMLTYFAAGIALGALLGIAGAFSALVTGLLGFFVTLFIMVMLRLSRLLYEAVEAAATLFVKAIPSGIFAILAPYLGGMLIAAPLAAALGVLATAVALWAGLVIGLALTGFMPWSVTAISVFGFTSLFAGYLFKPERTPLADVVLDVLALVVAPYLVPVIWTVGYAMLSSRRMAHRGLYFVGIAAATVVVYSKAVALLSLI